MYAVFSRAFKKHLLFSTVLPLRKKVSFALTASLQSTFELKIKSALGTVKAHKFASVNVFESDWNA